MILLRLARMLRDGENMHVRKFYRDGERGKRSAGVTFVESRV